MEKSQVDFELQDKLFKHKVKERNEAAEKVNQAEEQIKAIQNKYE